VADKYIPLGPGENARYLRNNLIVCIEPTIGQILKFDGENWVPTNYGGGDVSGPGTGTGSSTDNALVRWDGNTGQFIQDSIAILDDSGNLIGLNTVTMNTLIATNTITTGDNLIVLNDDVISVPTENSGIEITRGSETNSQLIWNESTDNWDCGIAGNLYQILTSYNITPDEADTLTNNTNANLLHYHTELINPVNSVTTTGIETKIAYSKILADNTVYWVNATVPIRRIDGGAFGSGVIKLETQVRREGGGTAELIGTQFQSAKRLTSISGDLNWQVSTNTIELIVTGNTSGTVLEWQPKIEIEKVS